MTSVTFAEKMIGENEQKKGLVFNLFKFRGGVDHTPDNSIFACQDEDAYNIPGS
jgi:hypothetical protein